MIEKENIKINANDIEISADKVNIIGTQQNNKVKIGYKEYEIVKEPELFNDKRQELLGEVDHNIETIRIASKFKQNIQNQAFIHELLHTIAEKNRLEVNNNEDEIDALATGIYEAILDNPHIFTMKDI
jgi:hypothetical protein